MKTIDQLQAEAAAAAEALAAARAAAAATKLAADAAEARQKRAADAEARRNAPIPAALYAQAAHLDAIATALLAAIGAVPGGETLVPLVSVAVSPPARTVRETEEGPQVSFAAPRLIVKHRGEEIFARVDFTEERSAGTAWRSGPATGRVRMTVGDYGDAQSFPPRKDGSFNYAAAAAKLVPALLHHERRFQNEQVKADNAGALAALRAEFGLLEYSDVVGTERFIRGYGGGKHGGGYTITAAPGTVLLALNAQVTPEQARAVLAAAVAAGVKL